MVHSRDASAGFDPLTLYRLALLPALQFRGPLVPKRDTMRTAFLRFLLPSAALLLAACSDGSVRSPDLPPLQLTGIGQVACAPSSIAVGQTSSCQVVGGCTYRRVNPDGSSSQIIGVCPDDLTFNSSNPGVAPVDPDTGVVTGGSPGNTNITASGGGQVSPPVTVIVNPACGESLSVTPATANLISGPNVGTSQVFTATLTLSNGQTQNVSTAGSTTWTSGNEDVLRFAANQATAQPGVTEQTNVTITATHSGNVCGPATTLTATAAVVVRPASVIGANGLCIETVPPAAVFTGCRAVTGACQAADPIELAVGETRQLQIRGIFDNGEECNVTSDTELAVPQTDIATVADSGLLTGVGAGQTAVNATFGGITASRRVNVVVNQVLGRNSLAVFALAGFDDDDATSLIDAQNRKFSCIGANNLIIDGLGNRTPRAALKVFAYAATCDSTALDGDGNCTAPVPDSQTDERSAAAFLATAEPQNVSNLPQRSAELLDDGIVWNSVAGYWGSQNGVMQCIQEQSNASANVGDQFFPPPRVLRLDDDGFPLEPDPNNEAEAGLPQGAFQVNGLVYADAAVRIGFNCVTATYENPENPGNTVTDGMTVLVLPVTNDILLSGSNDGNALCEALAPLFGSGPLLGLVEVTNVLSAVTSGLSPLLEALDAIPIDSLVTLLQTEILGPITGPLIDVLDQFLIDPVLEPIVCQITNGVDLLLGLLTGNPAPPQECGGP